MPIITLYRFKLKSQQKTPFYRCIFGIANLSEEKTAYYSGLNGGDGGSRTRVRKPLAKAFSERSQCFNIPSADRPQTGFPL